MVIYGYISDVISYPFIPTPHTIDFNFLLGFYNGILRKLSAETTLEWGIYDP